MKDERTNIILIITDQQRYDTIAALGFPYMDTPNLDRLVRGRRHLHQLLHHRALVRAVAGQPLHRLLPAHHRHPQERRPVAPLLGRAAWRTSGYYCVNIGKMHTFPYETPLGFHERYVVENKDRYLEAALLLRRVGQRPAGARAGQAAARTVSPAAGLRRASGRLRVGTARRPALRHVCRRHGASGGCDTKPKTNNRSSCRSAFPAHTRPTIQSRATPNRIWTRTCPCRT